MLDGGELFVLVQVKDGEPGLQGPLAHGQDRFLGRHVALLARRLFLRGGRRHALNLGLLQREIAFDIG